MSDRYFPIAEAAAMRGRRIKTLIEFAGVPVGTTGTVARYYIDCTPDGQAGLTIQWDLPNRFHKLEDGFTKSEYEKFLVEIQEPGEALARKGV